MYMSKVNLYSIKSAGSRRNGKRTHQFMLSLIQMIRLLSSIIQHYEGGSNESVVIKPDIEEEAEEDDTSCASNTSESGGYCIVMPVY